MHAEPNSKSDYKSNSLVLILKFNNSNRFLYFLVLTLLCIAYFLSSDSLQYFSIVGTESCVESSFARFATESENNLKLKLSKFSKCLEANWNPRHTTHSHAPIRYMPKGENIIFSNLSNASFCNSKHTNLRVLVIHSRCNSSELRNVIRSTYADFSKYPKDSLIGNWTKLFLVGKPNSEADQLKITEENYEFGDIVVANVEEGYYHQTSLQYLIGLKFVSCFCSHADYHVKVDDDTYLRHFFLAL